ncbi:MAG TPA: tetratricopeptide repeat protein [Bryobacteraceae bacterium]|nr:tetratricopeptide repeat protein [Bryobacteraceae bacterium]
MSWILAVPVSAGLLLAQHSAAVERAWDLVARGDRAQAVRVLRAAIEANPGDADARLLLGSVLVEQGDRTGALSQLSEAVRLRPRSSEAQNALGEALHDAGRAGEARAAFEKAASLDANFAQAHVNLGMVLAEAGEFEPAARHLDRAIALLGRTPDAAYPHYLRAKVYSARADAQHAAAELTLAVALRPDFAEAWSDLGQARKTLLDDRGALPAFERAVELKPDDAVARYRLGAQQLRLGNARAAIPQLEKALDLDAENQSALYSLQVALRREGQTGKAEQVKERLAALLRERDKARQNAVRAVELNNAGAALEKGGNLRAALEKYQAALALYPEHIGIRVNVAAALLHLGHWNQGIEELREAVRRDPGNATIRAALDAALAQAPAGTTSPE